MKKKIFTLFISLLAIVSLQAQTWDGSASTDWNTAANWNTNTVPISTGAVIIPGVGITNWPVMANDVTILRITMNSGSQLNTGGFNITLTAGGCSITGAVVTNGVTANTSVIFVPGGGTAINGSTFNGNFHFSTTSGNQFTNEANTAANTWNGNTTFTADAGETLLISNAFPSVFNGDLTINKPANITDNARADLFWAGALITGNFTLNWDENDRLWVGMLGNPIRIGGQLNMNINNVASSLQIYSLKNATDGGTIVINNVDVSLSMVQDSFLVNTVNITIISNSPMSLDSNYIKAAFTFNSTIALSNQTHSLRNTIFDGDVNITTVDANIADGNVQRCYYLGNATFNTTSGAITLSNSDTSWFYKNLTVNTPSGLTIRGARFVGNTNSIFEQLGSQPVSMGRLIMEKTAGANLTLNDSVTITTSVRFTSGNIISSTDKHLIFPNNISYTGASVASHVVGPVSKIGDDVFTFPIGTPASFNPVSMTAPAGVTSKFSAQYFHTDPTLNGYDTSLHSVTMQRISGCEYWDVKRLIGSSTTTLTFSIQNPCAGRWYIVDPTKVHIARWTGATWEDLGNGSSTGDSIGTVTTAAPVSNFSPFTFGSTDVLINVLPINLRSFDAHKCNADVCLVFSTANEQKFTHFEVEKSNNGSSSSFTEIATVLAKGNAAITWYSIKDNKPFAGLNYYRLKMVDKDGQFTYSTIVKVDFSKKYSISILPNPAQDHIIIHGADFFKQLQILDMTGKVVKQMNKEANNRYNIPGLKKGMYLVRLIGGGETITTKLIIE